ncbi:hypothetical protein BDZ88DRAFT_39445 [Geranomyces variabilis]|nr:hypothetical protein BDZ88DRAFT_39445 [Geranomyces variabilis]
MSLHDVNPRTFPLNNSTRLLFYLFYPPHTHKNPTPSQCPHTSTPTTSRLPPQLMSTPPQSLAVSTRLRLRRNRPRALRARALRSTRPTPSSTRPRAPARASAAASSRPVKLPSYYTLALRSPYALPFAFFCPLSAPVLYITYLFSLPLSRLRTLLL